MVGPQGEHLLVGGDGTLVVVQRHVVLGPIELDLDIAPRFQVGERVRVRNIHPPAHTRLPRYTRGKVGTVERDRGIFPLPDTEIYFEDPRPQHVYMIRFDARELWGEGAPAQDKLYIDMWEDYLEPA